MKKYKPFLDFFLLACLALISLLALAPKTFVMPTSAQMVLLAAAIALIAAFLVFLWREKPRDEREIQNQAVASRSAYIVGASVLIFALIIQSFKHEIDPATPITLFAMIATKLIVQNKRDR